MIENSYKQKRIVHVDKRIWRSLIVFIHIAGEWWFSVWVLIVLAGLIALALTIADIVKLPAPVWGSLLILGGVLAPLVAFHILRIERDTFNALWDDKVTIMAILDSIESLRNEAAPLQIRGMSLSSTRSVNKWIKEVDDWTQRTISTVRLLHPAEAGNVRTLGVFEAVLASGTKPLNAKHLSAIRNLVRRMAILAEIRDRWITKTS